MKVESAIARLAKARIGLAKRPRGEILDALCQLLERWRDPSSKVRREIAKELPRLSGFDPATLSAGLEVGFAPWTPEAFRVLVHTELDAAAQNQQSQAFGDWRWPRPHDFTSVVLAGAIPMPSLLSILLPLVLGSPVLCRRASRDPLTPALVAASLKEIDPLLGSGVEIVDFSKDDLSASRAFFSAPCVVATGSDRTIAEVAGLLEPHQRLVAYGHRVSLALVDLSDPDICAGIGTGIGTGVKEFKGRRDPCSPSENPIEGLALDLALWDQLGCLSPIAIYAVGQNAAVALLAQSIAEALARLELQLPRGEVDPEAAALIRRERSEAEMRAALGRPVALYASRGSEWTVILEDDAKLRPTPLHRFVRIVPVKDLSQLEAALHPVAPHLAGVALAGFGEMRPELERRLFALGASRICDPGSLQAPPFDWPRDNQPVLRSLAG